MKLLDKLKNALFEEEYVEVEEKPIKKEKPIAKKIVIPEAKKEAKKEIKKEPIIEEEKIETPKKDFKFPAILEDDFIDLNQEKPAPTKKESQKEPALPPQKEERAPYAYTKEKKKPVYQTKPSNIKIQEYGSYEKKIEKKNFQPSPIISPIYGILDQDYQKDEIVTRKEVRITSSYASKNIDLDAVRAKALGIDDDTIFEEELASSHKEKPKENEEIEEAMLDISDHAPAVPKVTVGDAEEYFKDLGLEYNIDYKDASHERATGRRTNLNQVDEEDQKADLEDNLFDLIDSMYEEKKGE